MLGKGQNEQNQSPTKAPLQRGERNRLGVLVFSLVLLAVILALVVWRMSGDDIDPELQQAIDNAECSHIEDEDLCKFFASWGVSDHYTLTATKEADGATTVIDLRQQNDSFHLEAAGDEPAETIAIGSTVYVRGDDGTWYEQTVDNGQVNSYKLDSDLTFDEPTSSAESQARTYTRTGTETCGDLTCFTYSVEGNDIDGSKRIWFDDKEYRLRRVKVTNDHGTYDASVSYDETENIQAPPEPVALDESQRVPPGQSSPEGSNNQDRVQGESSDLPVTGDQFNEEEYRQWLKQRRQ